MSGPWIKTPMPEAPKNMDPVTNALTGVGPRCLCLKCVIESDLTPCGKVLLACDTIAYAPFVLVNSAMTGWRHQCSAHTKSGARCRRWSVSFFHNCCRQHTDIDK